MTRLIEKYTTTGAKNAIDLDPGHLTTFRYYVSAGSATTPPTVSVEGKVHKDSDVWGAVKEVAPVINTAYVSDGSLEQIRINISNLGTATEVSFDVVGNRRV